MLHIKILSFAVIFLLLSTSSVLPFSANLKPVFAQTDPTIDTYNIAGSESLTLNPGSQQYFFVGSTAGGYQMNSMTWSSDLNVVASYSNNLGISIGHQTSNSGSYSSQAGNHGISGIGVSNISTYQTFAAQTQSSTSVSLQFTTESNDLVVILVGGEGDGSISLSGTTLQTLEDNTYSEAGSNVIASEAIYDGQLSAGTYTINLSTTTYPTNSGTSLGVVAYVFSNSASSSSSSLSDTFTSDTSLNTNLWETNGPVGNYVFTHIGSPSASIITPTIGFSQNGLGMSGVSGTYQAASIQSVQSFSAPFTLTTTVEGTIADGNPFVFGISNQAGSETGWITGNLNSANDGYYGISWGSGSSLGTQKIVSNPSTNIFYVLTISVDSTGSATFSVSSGGNQLGSITQQIGTGQFYVLLGQFEGLPYTVGSNQAYWQSVSLTSGSESPSLSTTTTSLICSPNPVSTSSATSCTATVVGSNPSGTITFSSSSASGSLSSASCTLSSGSCSVNYQDSKAGTDTITAIYSGDNNNKVSQTTSSLSVTAQFAFSVSTSGNLFTVNQGGQVSVPVSIGLVSGQAQPVSLSVAWIPTGSNQYFTTQFSTITADPPFNTQLTITLPDKVIPAGTYEAQIFATGGGSVNYAIIQLQVNPEILAVLNSDTSGGSQISILIPDCPPSSFTSSTIINNANCPVTTSPSNPSDIPIEGQPFDEFIQVQWNGFGDLNVPSIEATGITLSPNTSLPSWVDPTLVCNLIGGGSSLPNNGNNLPQISQIQPNTPTWLEYQCIEAWNVDNPNLVSAVISSTEQTALTDTITAIPVVGNIAGSMLTVALTVYSVTQGNFVIALDYTLGFSPTEFLPSQVAVTYTSTPSVTASIPNSQLNAIVWWIAAQVVLVPITSAMDIAAGAALVACPFTAGATCVVGAVLLSGTILSGPALTTWIETQLNGNGVTIYSSQATISNGCASSDQMLQTNLDVTVCGSNAPSGTTVTVISEELTSPNPGVSSSGLYDTSYSDVEIDGITDGTVQVCTQDSAADSSTTMQYWNGNAWVNAIAVTVSGTSVCGSIPTQDLTGTNIVVGNLLLSHGSSGEGSTPGFPPSFTTGFNPSEYPFTINGTGFKYQNYSLVSATNSTAVIQTGKLFAVRILEYGDTGPSSVQHVTLFTNLNDTKEDVQNSDTIISWDKTSGLVLVDPHHFFENVTVIPTQNDGKFELDGNITFARPSLNPDIILRTWGIDLFTTDTYIPHAWEASGKTYSTVFDDAVSTVPGNLTLPPLRFVLNNTTEQNSDQVPPLVQPSLSQASLVLTGSGNFTFDGQVYEPFDFKIACWLDEGCGSSSIEIGNSIMPVSSGTYSDVDGNPVISLSSSNLQCNVYNLGHAGKDITSKAVFECFGPLGSGISDNVVLAHQ